MKSTRNIKLKVVPLIFSTLISFTLDLLFIISLAINVAKNYVATFDVRMLSRNLIVKQPERFPKSYGHPKSMNKLTLKEPAMKQIHQIL